MASNQLMRCAHDHYTSRSNASELANEKLVAGKFYSTNATYPKEINYQDPQSSPLPSFHHLSSLERADLRRYLCEEKIEWHPSRVTQDTSARFGSGKSSKKRRQPSKKRPCYLAEYDHNTKVGIIFLASTQMALKNTSHRFATVNGGGNSLPKALTTDPVNAFTKTTYLNLSHPIRVKLLFIHKGTQGSFNRKFKSEIDPEQKPVVVGITEFDMQRGFHSVSFGKYSQKSFQMMHTSYHFKRPFAPEPSDGHDGGGGGPGGAGGRGGGGGPGDGGGGPGDGGGGCKRSRGGGNDAGDGDHRGDPRPRVGGNDAGDGDGNDAGDGDGNDAGEGNGEAHESSEAHESGDDEAFTTRGVLVLYHKPETDAPWGTIDGKRIGIDIPLVIEDFSPDYSDEEAFSSDYSDEEADISGYGSGKEVSDYVDEEVAIPGNDSYKEVSYCTDEEGAIPGDVSDKAVSDYIDEEVAIAGDVSNKKPNRDVGKGKEFDASQPSTSQAQVQQYSIEPQEVKAFTGDLNPNGKHSFALNLVGFPTRICGLLEYDPLNGEWNWKGICKKKFTSHAFLTKEGLYFEKCDGVQKVVNLHKNEAIVLPYTNEDNEPDMIRCMVVDTSTNTLQFKVIIGGYGCDTLIYDSNSHGTSMWRKLTSKYPLRDMQEWMTRGGTVVYDKNIVFILYHWRSDIVVFFMDIDKWGFITPPSDNFESLLCGVGCLDGRIYCSTTDQEALHIWRLDDCENDLEKNWEWEKFDSMPSGDYNWLLHNNDHIHNDHTQVRIFTSFGNHQVLFYSYSSDSSQRLVLFDLKKKGPWKRLSLLFKFETFQVENIQVESAEADDRQGDGHGEASTSHGRSVTEVPLVTIGEQGRVVLIGRTGSGKSTLAKMLVSGKLEDSPLAPIGGGVRGTTSTCKTYSGRGWTVVDTMGFGEPKGGTFPDSKMVAEFLKEVKGRYSHIIFVTEKGKLGAVDAYIWDTCRQIFSGGEKNFVVLFTKVDEVDWLDKNREHMERVFRKFKHFLCVDFPAVDIDSDKEKMNAEKRQEELERLEKQMKEMFQSSPWVEPDIFKMKDEEIEKKANSVLQNLSDFRRHFSF